MKNLNYKYWLIAAMAGIVANNAYAIEYFSQNATFTLTESYSEPALAAKDGSGKALPWDNVYSNEYSVDKGAVTTYTYEEASKITTFKITNKIILESLVLDEDSPIDSIVGYSIAYISSDEDTDSAGFYLLKNGQLPIDISDFIYSLDPESGARADTYSYKYVSVDDSDKGTSKETQSGKATGKQGIELYLRGYGLSIQLRGLLSYSQQLKSIGVGEGQYYAWVPGAAKVSSLSGDLHYEQEDYYSIVEGSGSLAAGVPVILFP